MSKRMRFRNNAMRSKEEEQIIRQHKGIEDQWRAMTGRRRGEQSNKEDMKEMKEEDSDQEGGEEEEIADGVSGRS